MTVTIYDVAREARVSMATVSRVVNGNQNVKPETRKKVNDVIQRLNYRPNAVARGLASKRTTTVGVIIPDISNIYYSQLARGIEDIATMYKYHSIISNSDNDDNIASVNIDFAKAAREVTEQLIKTGAKDFVLVSGDYSKKAQEDVLSGLKDALNKHQLKLNNTIELSGSESYKDGVNVFEKLKNNLPDAILSISDEQAIGILHSALDAGIKVPEELQIVSFNNTRLVEMVRPKLSSVIQPLYDIGAVGMRLLTKFMNEEDIAEPNVVLPHRIEYRNTTK